MKNGYRIVDTDTHVVPAMELLQDYGSTDLKRRWDELAPYLQLNPRPKTEYGDWERTNYLLNVAPYQYFRRFGEKPTDGNKIERGQKAKNPLSAAVSKGMKASPEPGVSHDNAEGRLRAMDLEGVDVHVLIPGTFAMASTGLDQSLSVELPASYNRYIVDYASADPARLRSSIQVHGGDPEWSAAEIKRLAEDRSVGAVTVVLPQDLPVDDPDLNPIWQAMDEADLPLLHHSFFYEPPYFPGYRDMWDNVVAARAAAHPWGAQRLVAFLMLSGLFDRYPHLRVGFAEVGAGWLPFWLYRLRGQMSYMRNAVPEQVRDPLEYAAEGRIFIGLEFYEDEKIARSIIDVLGEDVLMWQSDFPHPQCDWPDSPASVLGFTALTDREKRKVLADNAERYLRGS